MYKLRLPTKSQHPFNRTTEVFAEIELSTHITPAASDKPNFSYSNGQRTYQRENTRKHARTLAHTHTTHTHKINLTAVSVAVASFYLPVFLI